MKKGILDIENKPLTSESLGKIFKEARESQNLTIEDVSQKTYIKTQYIYAIEEDRYELLPAYVYTVGYIKTYANLLELDPKPLIEKYQQRIGNINREVIFKNPSSYLKPQVIDEQEMEEIEAKREMYREHNYRKLNSLNSNKSLYVERNLEGQVNLPLEEQNAKYQQAKDIISLAQKEAQYIRQSADQYADSVLAKLEQEILNTLTIVKNGKKFLKNRQPLINKIINATKI